MLKNSIIIVLIIIGFLTTSAGFSQEADYISLYNNDKYEDALKTITGRLEEIYLERIETVKIPSEFIDPKDKSEDIDLRLLFKKRKVKGFFIEDNKELSTLHLYAGKCYSRLLKNRDAINNYIQSLRYKHIVYEVDDQVLYEIAQVFKNMKQSTAYIHALESAYMLNQTNALYSFELAQALYKTTDRRKSIFHFEKYLKYTNEDIDPSIYLKIGNLYEDIGQHLQTEKYYIEYLKNNPHDGYIQLALGVNAYRKTGHFDLSTASLDQALKLLPENDIFRRSLAFEIKGDIHYHQKEFDKAINAYSETIKYQKDILKKITGMKTALNSLDDDINKHKKDLIKEKIYEDYEEYEYLLNEKGKQELALTDMENQFKKLNAGKIRWNIADSYERIKKYEDAIVYYREAIHFNYNENKARDKIVKLKLKIKRGY